MTTFLSLVPRDTRSAPHVLDNGGWCCRDCMVSDWHLHSLVHKDVIAWIQIIERRTWILRMWHPFNMLCSSLWRKTLQWCCGASQRMILASDLTDKTRTLRVVQRSWQLFRASWKWKEPQKLYSYQRQFSKQICLTSRTIHTTVDENNR